MKKVKNIIILIFLFNIILQLFMNNELIRNVIYFSYELFIINVLPNLFPFLVLSNLLINYGFVDICSKLFNPIMKKLFKMSGNCSFIFIMSLLTGFPSNAKYTKELLSNNQINDKEASKILMFTHFSNPLFVIGMINVFINMRCAVIILLCHYLGNIIIGILFRNLYVSNNYSNKIKNKQESFGICFSKSIKNSIDTLLLIFGVMTCFLIFTSIIQNIFNLNPFYKALIGGILEFTQGLKYVSLLPINTKIKSIIMEMFISFGGISVHMQVLSIISDTKIKYKLFFIARLLHSLISGLLVYILI